MLFKRVKNQDVDKEMTSKKENNPGTNNPTINKQLFLPKSSIPAGGPFASSLILVKFLYRLSCLGIFFWYVFGDYLLSRFITTTSKERSEHVILMIIKVVISLIVVFFFFPLFFVSLLVWYSLQLVRPRAYSYINSVSRNDVKASILKSETLPIQLIPKSLEVNYKTGSIEASYFLATANVCLMPESFARINNLSDTVNRASKIAAYFCGKPIQASTLKNLARSKHEEKHILNRFSSSESLNILENAANQTTEKMGDLRSIGSIGSVTSKEKVVTDSFPDCVDFICLQEIFDSRGAKRLLIGLKKKFPYIIYDVTWPIHNYRLAMLSSGLCIASRYPFIDITFRAFSAGSQSDKLACKGLLMTKVFLGKLSNNITLVGYLSNTHLQAWSRPSASAARCKQLNKIEEWLNHFIVTSIKYDDAKEIALFNVISGDFNFDKASYFDQKEQNCSFTKNFKDPCLNETGHQHSWVIGTQLHQNTIHESTVQTPHGLQKMLVSELERHRYVASTMQRKSSLQRAGDGKRKIDHILYKDCTNVSLSVQDFKFFTGLATLTDHIPLGMEFSCLMSQPTNN